MTHVVHVDDQELKVLAESGVHVARILPLLKVAYGLQIGKMPEMMMSGINVAYRNRWQ